jgi:hypothetical protein
MPNWCSCGLKITGPKKDLDSFKATLNTPNSDGVIDEFSFHQTVPMPSECFRGGLSLQDEIDHPLNWKSFGESMWGCKWDCSDPSVNIAQDSIEIKFETPWCPPKNWLENVSCKFPTLTFEMGYCEMGMHYYGEMIAENGNVSESTEDIPPDSFNDECEVVGSVLANHLKKWNIGTGG